MKRVEWIVVGIVAAAVLVTFLPARHRKEASAHEKPRARIGLVFDVGGRGDKSFNDSAYIGLMRAERELGVEVSYLEPIGSEDREAALRLFAARGFDFMIGVGFIFSSDINEVALAYPNARFACVDYASAHGGTPPPNVMGLKFREEQGSFLVGAVAGLVSKTGHVGFVGGMQMPLIEKFEHGYAAGVHEVCPTCIVHAAYAGTTPDAFKDPAKGKALANSQIAQSADVLFHASGSTGHGVFEAAKDAHVKAIGVDADQYDEMPGTVITSMIKRVDVAVFEAIRDITEGRFKPGISVFGLESEGIDYVHEGPHAAGIPAEAHARVNELKQKVISGAIKLPVE